jgi:uncharacterized protein (DUF1015 family)
MWYKLTAKKGIRSQDPVEGLDVSLLQSHLLMPILDIKDIRTDKRIDFVGGELFQVSDAGKLMPPKSTWFEPKLRSGVFIHELE